jgi:predicted alpha/beta-fold hydrolase
MGGGMLAHYVCEAGADCGLASAVAVSAPVDYRAIIASMSGSLTGRFFERVLVETVKRHFRPHTALFQGVDGVSVEGALRARTIREWHESVTCPLRGIESSAEFVSSVSFSHLLPRTAIPLLLINAESDPICPAASIPVRTALENENLLFCHTRGGGHTAFMTGLWPFGDGRTADAAWDTSAALEFTDAVLRQRQQPLDALQSATAELSPTVARTLASASLVRERKLAPQPALLAARGHLAMHDLRA